MHKRLGTIMIVFMLLSGCGKQEEQVEQVSVNSTEQSSREALSRKEESQSISKEEASKRQAEKSLAESKKQQESEDESKKATSASLSAKIKEMTANTKKETTSYTKEDYRNMIAAAGESQRKYIEKFPSDEQSALQTSFSARVAEYTRLLEAYPEDKVIIEQAFQDIEQSSNAITEDENSAYHDTQSEREAKVIQAEQIMAEYAYSTGDTYHRVTPETYSQYYGFEVLDELLSMAHLYAEPISFKYHDYVMGQGRQYDILDIYVNTEGTDIVLFVKHERIYTVLKSSVEPTEQMFHIGATQNEILNQFDQY